MMVAAGRDGAFSINSVGLERRPFPLSFSVRETDGCWTIQAAAAQAAELADVLVTAAVGTVVVVDVATNSFLDEEYKQWRPSRIAAAQGISCEVHSFGTLAAGVVGLGEEALVMRCDDLPRFLSGWSPYELTLVGLAGTPDAQRLDEIGLAIGIADHDRPVLPTLTGCHLWYSGHDDCYAWVETTDPRVPSVLLGRLLALLAGSALVDAGPVEVPDAAELTGPLLDLGHHWVGVPGTVSQNEVALNLSAVSAPWCLGQPTPEHIDRTALYDFSDRVWHLNGPC